MSAARPATVCGVALERGERVLYFHRADFRLQRIILWTAGILFLPVLVGLVFILLAVTFQRRYRNAQIVTNRRLIEISRTGEPTVVPLGELTDVNPLYPEFSAGGRLEHAIPALVLEAAVDGVREASDARARENPKVLPGHWNRAQGLRIETRSRGSRDILAHDPTSLGPFLAQILWDPHCVDRLPSVSFQS